MLCIFKKYSNRSKSPARNETSISEETRQIDFHEVSEVKYHVSNQSIAYSEKNKISVERYKDLYKNTNRAKCWAKTLI